MKLILFSVLVFLSVNGCESIPSTNWIQKWLVGFEFTGAPCSVTVSPNNNISVSFIDQPVFVTPVQETDTYIGELENNQVLVVQHDSRGTVYSVTHTIYDSNQNLVYGGFGTGDYIKECILHQKNRPPRSCKK